MTPEQPHITANNKKKLFLGFGLFVILGGCVAWRTSLLGRAPELLDQELKAAQRDGLAVTPDELRAKLAVPADQNAAQSLLTVFAKYKAWSSTPDGKAFSTSARKIETDPGNDLVDKLSPSLATAQPILDLLTDAVKYPKLAFERQWEKGPAITLPEYGEAKACSQLLNFKARTQIRKGDIAGALATLDTQAKLSALFGHEPFLIGVLVSDQMHSMVCTRVAEVMKQRGTDLSALESCEKVLADLGPSPDLSRVISTEFVMGLITADMLGRPGAGEVFGNTDTVIRVGKFGPARNVYKLRYVQTMRKLLADLKADGSDFERIRKTLEGVDESMSVHKDWTYGFAEIMSPVFSGVGLAAGTSQAEVNVLRSSVDLLEAKAKTGSVPSALPGSTGEWLDPFTNKPLIYRPSANGFLIYSVAADGHDNGGKPREKNIGLLGNFDIPFRYP